MSPDRVIVPFDARERIRRAFEAGFDTADMAVLLELPEYAVARELAAIRDQPHAAEQERTKRAARMAAAWNANGVDRAEVAKRFGFPSARAMSNALSDSRRFQCEIEEAAS